jgi:hypothetical protein
MRDSFIILVYDLRTVPYCVPYSYSILVPYSNFAFKKSGK